MAELQLPRSPDLSEQTFTLFQQLIRAQTGIWMRDSKRILVANRLRKRLLALGLESYEAYYRHLTRSPDAGQEAQYFVDAVSTNETYFCRGEEQFAALRESILPWLFRSRRRLDIWSAGSSSGEEPYSVYMAADQAARSAGWDGRIRVLATDINASVMAAAKQGVYGARSLRVIPKHYLAEYFDRVDEHRHAVKEEVKSHVVFQMHNLIRDDPPGSRFDIVFCRNVLIYFDRACQRLVVDEKLAPVLAPDGYLFVGSSESLAGCSTRFGYVRQLHSPIYRLSAASGRSAAG